MKYQHKSEQVEVSRLMCRPFFNPILLNFFIGYYKSNKKELSSWKEKPWIEILDTFSEIESSSKEQHFEMTSSF